MPYKGLKQPVRYAAVSLIASFGVDMAETIGWTKRSKRTVSATETTINSVTVFPISCAAPFRSPASRQKRQSCWQGLKPSYNKQIGHTAECL